MILGLHPLVFFAFLSWPVTYTIVSIIMYFCMGHRDKKDKKWEEEYDKWIKEGGGSGDL